MTDILLAEDDPDIREWVSVALEQDRIQVRTAPDGAAALVAYREKRPDLLILDVMMPKMSGWDVLLWIREHDRALPVMMLTAKSTESDKVQGLGIGADDYMTKPFGVRELRARVAALLRRASVNAANAITEDTFRFGSRELNVKTQTEFTDLELKVLKFLAAHPNEVVTREAMIAGIWGATYDGTNRTLDTRVAALRRKLGAEGVLIETIYGAGYRYRP